MQRQEESFETRRCHLTVSEKMCIFAPVLINYKNMNLNETIGVLKQYVENTTESYLECYGLKEKFASIKQKAEQALQNQGVLQYIDALRNGTVDEVAAQTNRSNNDIHDEFVEYYNKRGKKP
jgi:hypothetical protein